MKINVLDKGYITLVESFGSDLSVVNSARISFDKRVDELGEKDERLIKFLASHGHTSPFRHAFMQFEVYAPLMVARQWWKYIVGSDHTMDAWNESSRRYVTEEPLFYVPNEVEWRSAPSDRKQGSAEPVDIGKGEYYKRKLMEQIDWSMALYDQAIADGICVEQARLFLPAYGMYVRWYWTASLASVGHLLNQRLKEDAQVEFQHYAEALYLLAKDAFPVSIPQLVQGGEE